MADNRTFPLTGSGDTTAVARLVEKGGALTQSVVLDLGGAGAESLLSSANPLPVSDAGGSLTVDGTVDIGSALPAGTNAIGKLAANSGVDIGDVDVTSVVPGTGATSLGKAEDAPHSSGDTGVMALAVLNGSGNALAATDQDYIPLTTDDKGGLWVAGVHIEDDPAFTGDRGMAVHGVRRDSAVSSAGTDGDYATINLDSSGLLWTRVGTALPAGTNAIGKLAANSGVDIGDVDVTSISAGDNTIGRIKITDGTDVADVLDLTTANPLAVAILDGNGDQITSFGGGTQYTEGNTDASITGTAILWEDAADTLVAVSAAKPLPVGDGGGSITVDVGTALPAGTNAIGKLSANSGVDIGDVDVTSIIPGTGATNLGKAEDAIHASGDVGVMALGVRQDADAAFSADGDYAPLQFDANGFLKVNIKAGAGSGGTASTDDAAFTAAAGSGTPIMGFATSDAVDNGDVGVLKMNTSRELIVRLMGSDALSDPYEVKVGANGAVFTSVLAVVPGTDATSLGKAEDAAHTSGDVGVMALAVRNDAGTALAGTDGDYIPLSTDNSGALRVTGGGGGTQYTEDAAAAADPVGNALIMVRDDALSGQTTADGDNVAARGTDKGELYVKHVDAIPVTDNGGALTVDGTVTANLAAGTNNIGDVDVLSIAAGDNNIGNVDIVTVPTDPFGANADAASATGSISAKLRFIAGTGIPVTGNVAVTIAQDVMLGTDFSDVFGTASLLTTTQADDLVNTLDGINVTAFGYVFDGTTWDRLRGDSTNGALVNLGSNNDVTVTGTVTANAGTGTFTVSGSVTADTELPSAAALADNTANPTTPSVGTFPHWFDGTTWDRALGNATDGLLVNLGANNDVVLGAGTNGIGKLTANSGVDIGDVDVTSIIPGSGATNLGKAEDAAHSSGDVGVMALAVRRDAPASSTATDGEYATINTDANGGVYVSPLPRKTIKSAGGSAASSGNNTLVAAVASNKIKVIAFSLSTVSTTAVTCIFQSGASGTEIWRVVLQAISGGNTGANLATALPSHLFETAVNTLLNLNLSGAITVHWSVTYIEEA